MHVEACVHLHRVLQQIRGTGKRAGVALNPHTPMESVRDVLSELDAVLVMTVNPGFGGQAFLPFVLPKIAALRDDIERRGLDVDIAVDGGIAPDQFLAYTRHSDGTPLEPSFLENFLSLQLTGDWAD